MGKLYWVKSVLTKTKLVGGLLLLFLAIPAARAATSTFDFSTYSVPAAGSVSQSVSGVTVTTSTNTGSLSVWSNELFDYSNQGTTLTFNFSQAIPVSSFRAGFYGNSGSITSFNIVGKNGGTQTFSTTATYSQMYAGSGYPPYTVNVGGATVTSITVTAVGGGTVAYDADSIVFTPPPPTQTVASANLSADTGTSSTDWITKTASQTISGSVSAALNGNKVQVSYNGGSTWSDATTQPSGAGTTWSTTTTLSGSNTFEARVYNPSGSTAAFTHAFTLDTTAPTVPAITSMATDSGTSSTDGITNDSTPTLSGTAEANATVTVYRNSTSVANVTANGAGNWSYTSTTLADGSYSFTASATDVAGNSSAASTSRSVTIDTTAPAAPTITSMATDTGSSSTDGITSDTTPTLSGTAEANSIVTVYSGGSQVGTTIAGGAGNWSYTSTTLADGSYSFTATATDVAGNTSSASTAKAVTIDTTAPTTTISNINISNDTGASSTDFITKTASQTISGTLSANLASGEILYGSLDGGTTWTNVTSKVAGTAISWNGATLGSGTSSIKFKVTDTTGNDGPIASQAYTLDTTAPTAMASASDLHAPSGTSFTFTVSYNDGNSIDSTSISTGNVSVTGPGAVGALTVTGASYNTGTGVATYTVQAPHGGTWNMATDTGTYTVGINGNSVKDVAGNAVSANANAATFTVYSAPAPTVSAISPYSGPTAGGQAVTISGSGFTGANSVTIGGAPATSVVVVSATKITAVTPAGTAGTVSVTVITPMGGSGTGAGLYTYAASPGFAGISPNTGPTTGGMAVTISGSNFTAPATVSIGGAAATQVTVVSATQITALTPGHTPGAVSVSVTTPGGTVTGSGMYTYVENRPNPAKDPEVIGLINLQQETARHIWQAQIGNFQQHLESLHHVIGSNDAASSGQRGATGLAAAQAGGRVAAVTAGKPILLAANDVGSTVSSGWLANTLVSMMTTSSLTLDVAQLTGSNETTGGAARKDGGYELWGAGHVRIGTKKDQTGSNNIDYTTSGVSFGADRRFGEHLTLGLGIGYAQDHSEFGAAGTSGKTNGSNITVYGSYQPVTAMFVDFLLGYGTLSMDSTRYVTATGAIAQSNRSGDQLYGSLSAGYEYRHDTTLLSPYARYDYGQDQLDAATETGAGIYSLNYASQSFSTQQLSLGLRAQKSYVTSIGLVTPRARVEYQHHFSGNSQSTVAYADLMATRYSLTTPSTSTNSVLLGVGCSMVLKNNLNVNLDYQWGSSSNDEVNQTIFVRLSKAF